MCRSCPDVNKLRGMDTTILGQHRPFMSIKSFVQHSGWQEMVSLCSLIRLIGVCADRDQPEFLCSRSVKVPRSPCGHSGRLVNSLSPTWGYKLDISISENPYRLSIEIFISIYIAYIYCRIKTGSGEVCCHNARGRVRNRKSNPDGVAGGIWRTVRTSPSALWQQTPTDRS